jgi:hypothetical protein
LSKVKLYCIETAVIQRLRKYDPAERKVQSFCLQILNTAADSRYCLPAALVPLCIGRKRRGILQQQVQYGNSIAMALDLAHFGDVLVFFLPGDPAHFMDTLKILVAFITVSPPHYHLSDSAALTLED